VTEITSTFTVRFKSGLNSQETTSQAATILSAIRWQQVKQTSLQIMKVYKYGTE